MCAQEFGVHNIAYILVKFYNGYSQTGFNSFNDNCSHRDDLEQLAVGWESFVPLMNTVRCILWTYV